MSEVIRIKNASRIQLAAGDKADMLSEARELKVPGPVVDWLGTFDDSTVGAFMKVIRAAMSDAPDGGTRTAPDVGANRLTARERAMCQTKKIDPAKYAATRAGIRRVSRT